VSRLKELRKSILLGVYINLILLHILPIWLSNVFVTLTGPTHSYSGALIRQILLDEGIANQFFAMLSVPPPNCFIHIIQAVFNGIINAGVFDKLLHSLWIFSFLFLSRSFILKLNSRADYRPFFMFPFVFSFPFIMGFQNFLWGIIAILIAMHQLLRLQKGNETPLKMAFIHAGILLFAYSTHLIAFLIIPLMQIGFLVLHPHKAAFKKYWISVLIPFSVIVLPALYLKMQENWALAQLSLDVYHRMYDWLRMTSIITFASSEQWLIWPLGIIYFGLMVYAVYSVFRPSKPDKVNLFWLRMLTFGALGLFLVFLIVPETVFGSDHILVRIQLVSTIFLIPALACIRLKKVWTIPLASVFVVISLLHLKQQYIVWSQLGKSAAEYIEVVDQIPANSIVLPVIWSENQMLSNFPSLIGSRKQVIMLDNYEAGKNHFWITWKENMNPELYPELIRNSDGFCLNPDAYPMSINYLYTLGAPDVDSKCGQQAAILMKTQWDLVWTSSNGNTHLYKKKAQPTLL
jgi:hypothetical protein